jgi:hypothetical protein
MIDIISAEQAFNESKYRKDADRILKEAANGIKMAYEQGSFAVTISINSTIEKGAINLAINNLKEKGYKVSFEKKLLGIYLNIDWSLQVKGDDNR